MKIDIIMPNNELKQTIEVNEGISAEDVYKTCAASYPYSIYACNIDNKIEALSFLIDKPCTVEFLDIRTQAVNQIYQHSLTMLYLKAVADVMGDEEVQIKNSLNQGIYTEVSEHYNIDETVVENIEMVMKEYAKKELPFVKKVYSIDEAIDFLNENGMSKKIKILEESEFTDIRLYDLGGYKNFFYTDMVPTTGYLKYFELKKYKRGIVLRFPQPTSPDVILPHKDEVLLYKAFEEQEKWDKLLKVEFVSNLNDKIENGEYKHLIQLSEALHEKKIIEIADDIKKKKKRIILIAGPSSSGKTTFARRLSIELNVNGIFPLYLGTDDYFVERENTPLDENGKMNFECLEALDINLFNDNLNRLLDGETVDLPTFDFMTGHKVYGQRLTKIEKDQPIIIEGIHGLNDLLTEFIDKKQKYKIYISPLTQLNIDCHHRIQTTDARLLRRIVRDNMYRGHNAKNTFKMWPLVRKGEEENIFPFAGDSDAFFNSEHIYEISVLKKYAMPLLEAIGEDEREYGEAVRLINFLKFFKTIENDDVIVNNSILREFIGGSIFV